MGPLASVRGLFAFLCTDKVRGWMGHTCRIVLACASCSEGGSTCVRERSANSRPADPSGLRIINDEFIIIVILNHRKCLRGWVINGRVLEGRETAMGGPCEKKSLLGGLHSNSDRARGN
jgi:hypothetical protein